MSPSTFMKISFYLGLFLAVRPGFAQGPEAVNWDQIKLLRQKELNGEDLSQKEIKELEAATLEKLRTIRAPVLILHSDQHDLVKLNKPLFLPLMKEVGLDVQFREYPGYGHGFYFGAGDDRWGKGATKELVESIVTDVNRFLSEHSPK